MSRIDSFSNLAPLKMQRTPIKIRPIRLNRRFLFFSSLHPTQTRRPLGSSRKLMASNPGQNVHLVLPHNHVVVSSSRLANSSSQLVLSSSLSQSVVESSRRVVESSRRVVKSSRRVVESSRRAITRLFFNSSYYLSTCHVAFQLFVQRSRALFLKKEEPKGPGYYN